MRDLGSLRLDVGSDGRVVDRFVWEQPIARAQGQRGTHVESSNTCATRIGAETVATHMGKLPDRRMIALASVGEGLDEDVQVELRRVLAWVFDAEILAMPGIPPPPSAWDWDRRQYHSTPILRQLASVKPHWAERLVGMADVDLFVPSLNFVFGEADADRKGPTFCVDHVSQLARARCGT
jgi:hypothetical protein